MNRVEKIAKDIEEMKIQGAIEIALAAAQGLRAVIKESKAKNKKNFLSELKKAGDTLIKTRPSAVSLPNSVKIILHRIEQVEGKPPALKKDALKVVDTFSQNTKDAIKKIASFGAKKIEHGDKILVHCHSGSVMAILKEAFRRGKKFEVICTETRPWQQGFISAKELSSAGIPTSLIVDSAVHSFMQDVSKVLVGADSISVDGSLVNKIGTAQIALIAHEFKVPVLVAAELLKFDPASKYGSSVKIEQRPVKEIVDPKKLPKVKIRNPVFDVTLPDYIDMIITEEGIIPPEEAYTLIKEVFGWIKE